MTSGDETKWARQTSGSGGAGEGRGEWRGPQDMGMLVMEDGDVGYSGVFFFSFSSRALAASELSCEARATGLPLGSARFSEAARSAAEVVGQRNRNGERRE